MIPSLFAKATTEEAFQWIRILNEYCAASGQKINLTKSGIICGKGVPRQTQLFLVNILNMQIWDNPGRYLGLPGDWGRSKVNALAWIKERIFSKVEGWKESLLNQAGKEVLIKAVPQAIPVYAMGVVRFPKSFCQSMCAQIAIFWWAKPGKNRSIHWRSWETISARKNEGGMGFRDFAQMNSSLLAKQAWRILNNPNALWVRVLKDIYFKDVDFTWAKVKRNSSWAWRSRLHGRDVLLQSGRWSIGNGEQVRVAGDLWLPSGDIIPLTGTTENLMVSDLIDKNNACWDYLKIRNVLPPTLATKVVQTPFRWTNGQDKLIWPASNSGEYTVRTGYKEVRRLHQRPNPSPSPSTTVDMSIWKAIWNAKVPQKIKIFLWKACHNCLPIQVNMRKRRLCNSQLCLVCGEDAETIEHAFLLCAWTRPLWFGSQMALCPRPDNVSIFSTWFGQCIAKFKKNVEFFDYALTSLSCTLWMIWKARNSCVFQGTKPQPMVTIYQTNLLIAYYTKNISPPSQGREIQRGQGHQRGPWRPPLKGVFKLNVDSSFCQNTNICFAGILARDYQGFMVTGSHKEKFCTYQSDSRDFINP